MGLWPVAFEFITHLTIILYWTKCACGCAWSILGYNQSMSAAFLFKEYIQWHYETAVREFWEIWKNFLWFGYDFFSIPLLVRTLFSPIYRIHEKYDIRHLQIELILQSLAVNAVARVIGLIMRLVVLLAGVTFELFLILLGPVLFVVWIVLPMLTLGLFVGGVLLIV